MPNNQPTKQLTRAAVYAHKRLRLLEIAHAQGNAPTVAQLAALYSTMANQPHAYPASYWQRLNSLASQARGVTVQCVACGPSHTVAGPRMGERIPCPACKGTGHREIHKPFGAAGPLPKPPAVDRLMEQLGQVLGQL